MSKEENDVTSPTFKELEAAAERQLSTTSEPKNGGGSIGDFYNALSSPDFNIEDVPLIISFPQKRV